MEFSRLGSLEVFNRHAGTCKHSINSRPFSRKFPRELQMPKRAMCARDADVSENEAEADRYFQVSSAAHLLLGLAGDGKIEGTFWGVFAFCRRQMESLLPRKMFKQFSPYQFTSWVEGRAAMCPYVCPFCSFARA